MSELTIHQQLTHARSALSEKVQEVRHQIHSLKSAIESGCLEKPQEAVPMLSRALSKLNEISS